MDIISKEPNREENSEENYKEDEQDKSIKSRVEQKMDKGLLVKVSENEDYNRPEGDLECYKAHLDFWLHYLGTKKMDGETSQHWLEKERDRLRQQLTIIEEMIKGFER